MAAKADDGDRRVREGLDRGRARAIAAAKERGAITELRVRRQLDVDILAGHGTWGRSSRIALALGDVSQRQVRRILKRLGHALCVSDSSEQTPPVAETEDA